MGGSTLNAQALRAYRAIIFDLDGTLVVLRIDWMAVKREMLSMAQERFGRDLSGMTVWQMLRSSKGPTKEALEEVLQLREVEGARAAEKLPAADLLPSLTDRGVGIVSLNSKESCIIALERTGLAPHVNALVAREDSERLKPDPEPLLKCIQLLGVRVSEAVFIGDRERDRLTAERAGVRFVHTRDIRPR